MFDFAPHFSRSSAFHCAADGVYNGASPSRGGTGDDANPKPMNNLLEKPATSEIAADEFVDFYAMLDQPADAPTIQLRSRLNEMYAEAQANRDHRNPQRRRQYATHLFWIPQARNVLLHEGKRAKYDAYAAQAKNGVQTTNFRAYLDELVGEIDGVNEGESILGLRDADAMAAPEARLSPRLDAVRAAAGEAAKIAASSANASSNNASFANEATDIAPNFAAAKSSVSSSIETSTEEVPFALAPRRATSGETPTVTTSQPADSSATPRATARRASKVAMNPSLQRERASLLSSAIGGATLFVVLLVSRVALPHIDLAILSGISFVAAFVVWRATRARMLRGLNSKRVK